MKKKGKTKLDFETKYQNSIKLFSMEMEQIPMENLEIMLPIFKKVDDTRTLYESLAGTPSFDFLNDFNYFLSVPNIRNIKVLHMTRWVVTKLEFDLHSKLMQAVQGTLEELIISEVCYLTPEEGNGCELPENLHFPKLRIFRLDLMVWDEFDSNWLRNLFRGITNVSTIDLSCGYDSPDLLFLEYLDQDSSSFSNLEELILSNLPPNVMRNILQLKLMKHLKN